MQNLWLEWKDEADITGVCDFYGFQALVCQSMLEGGECFVRMRVKPEKLGEFIEKGFTAEQAKDELMKLMAEQNDQPEIHSKTTPASTAENESNPVFETAKARAEQANQS